MEKTPTNTFRAKARAVDLLGRNQIADLPTAISELWKNGYDAYADNLQCNLYLKGYKGIKSSIFTLSDDGFGMTENDIINKWLILATDSKVDQQRELTDEARLYKPVRVPMGEKGIGRLSVAYLGNKMLMLTKKKGHSYAALFIDWQILLNNNLFLDDVTIPVETFDDIKALPSQFIKLVSDFKENFKTGDWSTHQWLQDKANAELANIGELPDFLPSEIAAHFSSSEEHGTMFIIFDPHEQLELLNYDDRLDIKDDSDSDYIRSVLSGLYKGFSKEKEINTNFWIHTEQGKRDLIASQYFFTEDDIYSVDHWLKGSFDRDGFFSGEVQVYNQIFKHTFRPVRAPGKSSYGPFTMLFGYLEGEKKSSKLADEQWDIINNKLRRFGGLYIYRDDFRVLPYGKKEADFLGFEERRSLGASYYFFSYRRMCGYISITRENNPNLIDKAGREGFVANKAHREFVADLKDFFKDLSVKYFRSVGEKETPTLRHQQLEDIQNNYIKLKEQEKKKTKLTRKKFNEEVEKNTLELQSIIEELNVLYDKLEEENNKSILLYDQIELTFNSIREKRLRLQELQLNKPKTIELTTSQKSKYSAYKEQYADSQALVVRCIGLVDKTQKKLTSENLKLEFDNRFAYYKKDLMNSLRGYYNQYNKLTQQLAESIRQESEIIEKAFFEKTANIIPSANESRDELEKKILLLENTYKSIKDEVVEKFTPFIRHIDQLSLDVDDELLFEWYKNEYEKISSKIDAINELAQLGIAIEIIDHQFNVLYSEIAHSIEIFDKYTEKNKSLRREFLQLKSSFQHLEGNHRLLVPLYRTTRKYKDTISGESIYGYLQEFFEKQLLKYRIKLEADKSFLGYEFYTYDSIIKPVFLNIINNALYWLIPSNERIIRLAYKDDKVLIMNSGEKIESTYLEDIFTLFFTRKPDGRGIGLYLARTNLRANGYDIYATNDKKLNQLNGACFVIEPYNKNTDSANV